jgi:hypothetical protein
MKVLVNNANWTNSKMPFTHIKNIYHIIVKIITFCCKKNQQKIPSIIITVPATVKSQPKFKQFLLFFLETSRNKHMICPPKVQVHSICSKVIKVNKVTYCSRLLAVVFFKPPSSSSKLRHHHYVIHSIVTGHRHMS